MGNKREDLEKLLKLIENVSEQKGNEWFKRELGLRYSNSSSTKTNSSQLNTESGLILDLSPIKNDTTAIRESLEIRGNYSIDYTFVENERTMSQLKIDNLKMENAMMDTTLKIDTERFYIFCVNAFYQIEELLNYYYFIVAKNNIDLIIEQILKHPKIKFTRNDKMKNVGDISVYHKMELFTSTHDFNKKTSAVFHNIRNVRNMEMHRCSVIYEESGPILLKNEELQKRKKEYMATNQESAKYYPMSTADWAIENEASILLFIMDRNFSLVRNALILLVDSAKNDLTNN
jgi:hypothetical protein